MLAEHQRDAVRRASDVLDRCGGAILADEPGLGKSFIAAEMARCEERRGASVEIVVPASLVGQWNETLRRFGVTARIMTHDGIITDPTLPQPRRRLIVVDEAHAFRNPRTQRYDALARRSPGARMLLVTATPLCNSPLDLRALIDLIAADDALSCRGVPSIDVAFDGNDRDAIAIVVAELVIRRDRSVLPPELQFGSLDARVIRYDLLDAQQAIEALRFPLVGESAILRQFLWRRLESSEAALLESVRRQRRFYERALECLAAGSALPKREYRRAFAHEEDADAVQQVLFWQLFVAGGTTADAQEIEAEVLRLDELRTCVAASPRRKSRLLQEAVGDEPALVFTGWAATAADLAETLRSRRAALATGRDRKRAMEAIDAFCSGRADVLVATDLAAEGLNLQRAGVVIHYDFPWNPVKIDQRNGRALRIGQRRDSVRAVYFLPNDERSGVLRVVARKNEMRRRVVPASSPAFESPAGGRRSTIRSRVAADAAIVKFAEIADIPDALSRRHKVGIERLLGALSGEVLDARKLRDFSELVAFEPWAGSRPHIIAPWTS
ncbi:MAG TPA: DEAD/DEAH box helicase [Thermoanaerobaculia bacterium]|nr:DEAD/DEAH box helicase [Thermoanaerobaculia bacterium]